MPTCKVCGLIHYYSPCPDCLKLYKQDISENHIPPQFIEAGETLTYQDWADIRYAEIHCGVCVGTPEEREQMKVRRVNYAIESCLLAHQLRREAEERKKNPGQASQQKADEIRSHYTY